jgi:carbonic anhydrase/acetyltransferase-like protein (isoleucine patch superfamily)
MKIDWKQKLSSRKFWAMLVGQITAILAACNAGENVILQVSAVIASVGTLVVYILAETSVDKNRTEMLIETATKIDDES